MFGRKRLARENAILRNALAWYADSTNSGISRGSFDGLVRHGCLFVIRLVDEFGCRANFCC